MRLLWWKLGFVGALISVDILVGVIRGITRVNSAQNLHFVIGLGVDFIDCLKFWDRLVGEDGVANSYVNEWARADKFPQAFSWAERESDGDNGFVVAYGVVEHGFFERAHVGIIKPHRALGEEM